MNRFLLALLFVGIGLAQPGCAWMKKHPKAQPVVGPQLVGSIMIVNLESGFVLIDSGTHPGPAAGIKLKSKTGAVESAELKVSEIRRNPFTIADIVKGTPLKGDLVYQ